jgi:hypothetical protein
MFVIRRPDLKFWTGDAWLPWSYAPALAVFYLTDEAAQAFLDATPSCSGAHVEHAPAGKF